MKALGYIPVESTRNNAGLPVARLNPRDRLQSLLSRVPSCLGIEYDRVQTLDDLEFQIEHEIDLAQDGGGSITTPSRMKTAKALLSKVKSAPRLNVTDRALRYRANEEPPEGPEICAMCGSKHFVEIDHIDGFEEHGEPDNLMWICRSCNTRKGIAMRNAGLGRRTHQYNPSGGARNLGQWLQAVGAIRPHVDRGDRGLVSDMKVSDAVAMIRATPQWKRSEFAQQLNKHKRRRRDEVPF